MLWRLPLPGPLRPFFELHTFLQMILRRNTFTKASLPHMASKTLISAAIASTLGGGVHAALFNPEGTASWDEALYIENSSGSASPTGISFSGGSTSEPVRFDFNKAVSIDLGQRGGTADDWSAYGVWVQNSVNGSALINFNSSLDITIRDVTSLGVGILSGTAWGFGGPNGQDNGTTVTLNGPVTLSISGTSVTGVVAGSHFNNNTNPGGKVVFNDEGDGSVNRIDVVSDWTQLPNEDRNSDWAVGLLAFDDGEMIVNRDTSVSLSVANFLTTYTGTAGKSDDFADIAAAVYVDNSSRFTLTNDHELHISIESNGTGIGAPNFAAPIFGIMAGAHEAATDPTEHSQVELNGSTFINMTVRPADSPRQQSVTTGMAAFGGSSITADGPVSISMDFAEGQSASDLDQNDKDVNAVWAGAYPASMLVNLKGSGKVTISDGLSVTLPEGVNPALEQFRALYATGYSRNDKWSTLLVDNTESLAPVVVAGSIIADNGGYINIKLTGAESSLTSNVTTEDGSHKSYVYLTLSDGARWNALESIENSKVLSSILNNPENSLHRLTLNSGGTLNMSRPQALSEFDLAFGGYELVRVADALTINDGLIVLDSNITATEQKGEFTTWLSKPLPSTDQLIVEGKAEGSGSLSIHFTPGEIPVDKMASLNWLIHQEEGSMTLSGEDGRNEFSGAGMASVWSLAFVKSGDEALLETEEGRESLTNTSDGKGDWYLIRDQTAVTPEIDDNITIGTSASQALAYMADLEDLRKRLGEVRYGAQAGAWVKAFGKQDRVKASGGRGFEQEVYGINLGLDALTGTSEESSWLVGGAFRYANADQEGVGIGGTTGDLDEYSFKVYATWMHEKGSYADFVLQAGRYEQEIDGLDNTGAGKSHADYGTWGFGASVEVGHMFSFGEETDDRRWFNHWFVEPQLELSYFHAKGADYSTSTGLKVSQENADFLTGRAGLVIGKKFSYGSIDDLDRRYFQIAVIGGVKHEFLGGDQTIRYTGVDGVRRAARADDIAGTRFYYGLNADWQMSDDWRLYAQIDREEGDHYTKDYDVSIGLKYSF